MATQTFRDVSSKADLENIKDDLLRSDEHTTYLPRLIGPQRPSKM